MKRDEPRDPNSPTSLSSLCSSLTLKQLYLVQSLFSHLQQPFDTQVKWLTDCYPICYMYGVLWLYTCTVWPPSPHLPFLQTGPGCGGTEAVVAWSGPGTIHQVWWAAASHSVVWWSPHSTHVTYTCCNMSHIHQWCFTICKYNQWRVLTVNFSNSVTPISVTNPSLLICWLWFNLVENWFHPLPRCFSSEQWVTMAI